MEEIASIASTPGLSVSVRREISPFLPFFFASVSKSAATILAPLLASSVLPALSETLSLEPRIDRYRTALSESLDGLVVLLRDHGRAMLGQDVWQLWLSAATMGLWDGSKKMVSTCDRALKVLGRVAKLLTEPVPSADPWRTDRRAVHKGISTALKVASAPLPLARSRNLPSDGRRISSLAARRTRRSTRLTKAASSG